MKTRQRQLLNRLICHIILYTFLWVTFAPGLTFAAGTTPPSSSKGKKKAVTKSKFPRNPKEAEKMYAARDQARIKKEQAKHKAASDALDKKPPEKLKKPEQVYIVTQIMDNGKKHVFKHPETLEEPGSFVTPQKLTKDYSTTPPDEGLFRGIKYWPGTSGWVYVDVTPTTEDPDRDHCYVAGSYNEYKEDNLQELIYRRTKSQPNNPTGQSQYFIITHACKVPFDSWENPILLRVAYQSWYDENNNRKSRTWTYGFDGLEVVNDTGVQDGWSSEIHIYWGVISYNDSMIGTWGFR